MELPNLDEYFARFDQGHPRSLYLRDRSLASLGAQLRLAREEMGFSLREAARVSGLTRTQLRRLEGHGDARLAVFLRLAEVYGCRLEVTTSFPEMAPLWKRDNLRRRDEWEAMRRRQYWRRRGYTVRGPEPPRSLRGPDVPPNPPAA